MCCINKSFSDTFLKWGAKGRGWEIVVAAAVPYFNAAITPRKMERQPGDASGKIV